MYPIKYMSLYVFLDLRTVAFILLLDKILLLLSYYSIYERLLLSVIMSFTADYKLQCNLACIVIYFYS
jgi:hypothetical protein